MKEEDNVFKPNRITALLPSDDSFLWLGTGDGVILLLSIQNMYSSPASGTHEMSEPDSPRSNEHTEELLLQETYDDSARRGSEVLGRESFSKDLVLVGSTICEAKIILPNLESCDSLAHPSIHLLVRPFPYSVLSKDLDLRCLIIGFDDQTRSTGRACQRQVPCLPRLFDTELDQSLRYLCLMAPPKGFSPSGRTTASTSPHHRTSVSQQQRLEPRTLA
ncbi:unnamed protein product [Protopolystoma xenopodis]|uniref:Uncharacterized protein n=1 Tax=Protopolystoma xenopodis TaxID=117903 RepID=A0A448WKF7_9PLAT|nr:unnamed protein product [Protopolystoma xenopodis]